MPRASRDPTVEDLLVHSPVPEARRTAASAELAFGLRGNSMSAWMKLR